MSKNMVDFERPVLSGAHERVGGQTENEAFGGEIEAYTQLLEYIEDVEGVQLDRGGSRMSLAFLIEELKKRNPAGWQEDVAEIKERVEQAARAGGVVEVTWLLSDIVGSFYIEFLQRRQEQVDDEDLKEKLGLMRQMAENLSALAEKNHAQGEPVSFGGVSLDYAPEWYSHIKE